MVPVTPTMLRDDWDDHPIASRPEVRARLDTLTDLELQEVLTKAFAAHARMWSHILDNTRNDATAALLTSIGVDPHDLDE